MCVLGGITLAIPPFPTPTVAGSDSKVAWECPHARSTNQVVLGLPMAYHGRPGERSNISWPPSLATLGDHMDRDRPTSYPGRQLPNWISKAPMSTLQALTRC